MEPTKRKCKNCGDAFLIIKQEKEFYREKGLPEPSLCPLCRQEKRLSLRSEQKFYGSNCDNCGKDIIIAFEHPKDQNVFCKECYLEYFDKTDFIIKD